MIFTSDCCLEGESRQPGAWCSISVSGTLSGTLVSSSAGLLKSGWSLTAGQTFFKSLLGGEVAPRQLLSPGADFSAEMEELFSAELTSGPPLADGLSWTSLTCAKNAILGRCVYRLNTQEKIWYFFHKYFSSKKIGFGTIRLVLRIHRRKKFLYGTHNTERK